MIDITKYNIIHHVYGGSIQHGTFNRDSDYDHRVVYVKPTIEILSQFSNNNVVDKHIISEDKREDYNMIEVGSFFNQLYKCNPNSIEILYSKDVRGRDNFKTLKEIYMGNIFDEKLFCKACIGMAVSNMTRFEKSTAHSQNLKYAIEALRILCMCRYTLKDGIIYMNVKKYDEYDELFFPLLQLYNDSDYSYTSPNVIIDINEKFTELKDYIHKKTLNMKDNQYHNTGMLNDELYKIRMENLKAINLTAE